MLFNILHNTEYVI